MSVQSSPYVITTERAQRTSAAAIVNLFAQWYIATGLKGCSSHSGRRTFITNAARKISTVGGSSGTSKCSLDIEHSPPPSATSKRTWKLRNRWLIWFDTQRVRRNGLNSPIEMDRLDEKQYTSFRGAPKPVPRGKHVMQTKASGELSA